MMTSAECRDNAIKCYRLSQEMFEPEIRQELLDLVVKWRALANSIDQARTEPH